MSDEAARFREKAENCRRLAKAARDEAARGELENIADELEIEAAKIDVDLKNSGPD
jgi:hypothetical protein